MPIKNPLTLIFLVDGARPDVLEELIESGDLPNIKKIVQNGTFRHAVSCSPSTTGPAYLPFLTGCFPGTLNIPGIRWLDKAEFARKKFGLYRFRSYNGIEEPLFDSDLTPGHPTLYEIFTRPYNIFSMITRGLPDGHNLAGRLKPFLYLYAHLRGRWDIVDTVSFRNLMRILDSNPDFVFSVFPGIDSYSHLNHPRHEKVIAAYKYVDFVVGKIVQKLQKTGRWDNTLLIITSDHGLTATAKHLDLAIFLKRRKINTLFYPVVWKLNPQAAVMISGNALGHIYWLGDNGAPAPANCNQVIADIRGELLRQPEVDIIIYRSDKSSIMIESEKGAALIKHSNGRTSYIPQSSDPLNLGSLASPMDKLQSLETTFNSDYPDSLVQIEQLFSSPRCGDMVVISKNGSDLRSAFEWPEHHASHGSLHREHMIVPLIYNQTGWDGRPARTTDIFNTILKWSGNIPLENTDGDPLF
jgi:hypothetical protein